MLAMAMAATAANSALVSHEAAKVISHTPVHRLVLLAGQRAQAA